MTIEDLQKQVDLESDKTDKRFVSIDKKIDSVLLLSTNHISHLEVAVADLATNISDMNMNLSNLLNQIIEKFK